jgi:RNA polymerase sigma-70 factor (ECF subfamily)
MAGSLAGYHSEIPCQSLDGLDGNRTHWDSAARVKELGADHGFLEAFVNARLPNEVRRQYGASDVVQSVLLSASKSAHAFEGSSETEFRAWIFEIARNRITDGIRRFRSHQRKIGLHADRAKCGLWNTVDNDTPSVHVMVEEDALALIHAMDALPTDMRQVVLLRYSGGLTFEQIASELQIPLSTCRRRWLGACKLLQNQLRSLVS